ncbi:MAG: hypothetical protein ABIJ96_09505 [Elusimicrobiota bacterium]
MRRELKKLFSGFVVLALLSTEIGAAQLAPILPPSLLRPPALQPGNPVPYLPPQRARDFGAGKAYRLGEKSMLAGLGRAAASRLAAGRITGAEYLSRPAQNWAVYKQVYGRRIAAYLSRPARNWSIYKGAVERKLSGLRAPALSLPRLPELTLLKRFAGDVWEGICATVSGISGLTEVIGFIKPEAVTIMPVPIPTGHTRALSGLLGFDEKPQAPVQAAKPRGSSVSFVVPMRRPPPVFPAGSRMPRGANRAVLVSAPRPVWDTLFDHWTTFMMMMRLEHMRPNQGGSRSAIWTQPDVSLSLLREKRKEGRPLPRLSTYMLFAEGSSGSNPDALLSFRRFKDDRFGRRSKSMVFGLYTDLKKGIERLENVRPLGRDLVELTMADGSTKPMKIKEVQELSPLVLDLDGDGVLTSSRDVRFDLDADGRPDLLSDIAAGDAVLVFDADGDGIAGENGKELFGDLTDLTAAGGEAGYRDGFASLAVLVERAADEGVITRAAFDSGRLGAEELAALGRRYGLRAKLGSLNAPAVTLAEAGIASLTLSNKATTRVSNFDGRGNSLSSRDGAEFTRADGSTGSYGDVWFKYLSGAHDPALTS